MNWPKRAFFLSAILTVVPNGLAAQDTATTPPPPPCSAPEFRQFDFWIGKWDLTWTDSGRGANTITYELDSCVVEENFTTLGDGPAFRGRSMSTFNVRTGQWHQTWVDNNGGYLDFSGEFKNDRMTLSRQATDTSGATFMQRMVWFNITAGSFDWNWERSGDDGATWQTQWAIHYQRQK